MIRPSSLGLAEKCSHFVDLAEKYPETSEAAERGNVVDEEISAALSGKAPPSDADAIACTNLFGGEILPPNNAAVSLHEKVILYDPDTGETLTEGTPDVQILYGRLVITVDWKKREQYYSGYLSDPDDNLQLHSYSLAKAFAAGATSYQNIIVIFGDGKAEAVEGRVFVIHEWNPILDRIRKVQAKERTPSPGAHCANCWQRWVCGSYRERAKLGLTLLGDGTISGPLSDEQAALLVERATAVKQAAELALDLAKAHQRGGGHIVKDGKQYVPTVCQGRETGNVEMLRADGLTKYIKKGASFDRWGWRRISVHGKVRP